MVEILQSLKVQADDFESSKREFDILAVAVVNIGYNMVMDFGPHLFVKQLEGWKDTEKASDGSSCE